MYTTADEAVSPETDMFRAWNQESGRAWALLPLRLIIGFGFMAHGYAKLSAGPQKFASMLETLEVPAPELMAWLTALVEFFGGLAVLAGAFIPIVSIPLAIVMLVAIFTVHLPHGFSSIIAVCTWVRPYTTLLNLRKLGDISEPGRTQLPTAISSRE